MSKNLWLTRSPPKCNITTPPKGEKKFSLRKLIKRHLTCEIIQVYILVSFASVLQWDVGYVDLQF